MANQLLPPRWSDHGKFGTGMVQDVPRHMIPDSAVWDAQDCFINEDGTLHKRGSTVTALSAGSTISGSVVGVAQLDTETTLLKGYVVDESNGAGNIIIVGAFTPGSGTFAVTTSSTTQLVSTAGVGRPFQHNGYMLTPVRAPLTGTGGYRMFMAMAGSTNSLRQNTTSITVTANNRATTGWAAGDVAAMAAGDILFIPKAAAVDAYMGRVTKIVGTTVYVTPTPTRSFVSGVVTFTSATISAYLDISGISTKRAYRGAQGGASWQNRAVWCGVVNEYISSGVYDHHPNRIIWSLLPTETSAANTAADGDLWLSDFGYPDNNYADVPWMDLCRGVEPVSDGELLITGRPICSRLVGTLNTNTSTSGGLTYELRPLNQRIMCIDDRATVKTPIGVMMMGPDGVYLYREGNLVNTMTGRIQNYFLNTIAAATVYGAGMLPNNHYYLSTSGGTLLCNLDGFRWTRFQNTDLTNAIIDPSNTTRVFAARFQPGTASNTTKLVRVDYLVKPSSAATTDVSGTGPIMTVKTKSYPEGDTSQLKSFKHASATVRMPGSTGSVAVYSNPGLDGEEAQVTLGTIAVGTSAQTKRYDTTTISRANALQFVQSGNPDECELLDVDFATKTLRNGRIT